MRASSSRRRNPMASKKSVPGARSMYAERSGQSVSHDFPKWKPRPSAVAVRDENYRFLTQLLFVLCRVLWDGLRRRLRIHLVFFSEIFDCLAFEPADKIMII